MVESQTDNQANATSSQAQGIKVAVLIMSAVSIVLLFLPWISSPFIAQFAGIASYVSGQTVQSELSIPSLFFVSCDLLNYGNALAQSSSYSSSTATALVDIFIVALLLATVWLWALLDSLISGLVVLSGKKESSFMVRASAVCVSASGATIALSFFIDIAIKGSMSKATSGLSSYVGVAYLSPTFWAWLVLIISIAELVLLKLGPNDPRIASAASKVTDLANGVSSGSSEKYNSANRSIAKEIDKLYASYGKAAFEAIKADPALPKIAPKEWSEIDDLIKAEAARKQEEERKAAEAKRLEAERKAEEAKRLEEERKSRALESSQVQSGGAASKPKSIKCPVCASEMAATSRFCPECGYKRTVVIDEPSSVNREPELCHACGAPLKPGASFCGKCGNKVR